MKNFYKVSQQGNDILKVYWDTFNENLISDNYFILCSGIRF